MIEQDVSEAIEQMLDSDIEIFEYIRQSSEVEKFVEETLDLRAEIVSDYILSPGTGEPFTDRVAKTALLCLIYFQLESDEKESLTRTYELAAGLYTDKSRLSEQMKVSETYQVISKFCEENADTKTGGYYDMLKYFLESDVEISEAVERMTEKLYDTIHQFA